MCLPGFIDAHNHLASMAITKVGINLSGVLGMNRCWRSFENGSPRSRRTSLRGYGWMPDSFEERSPRREWLDKITGGLPMYLLSADAHDCWFNTAAMRTAGIGPNTLDPDPGSQYLCGIPTEPRRAMLSRVPISRS